MLTIDYAVKDLYDNGRLTMEGMETLSEILTILYSCGFEQLRVTDHLMLAWGLSRPRAEALTIWAFFKLTA